jgi:hypothetical protein
MQPRPALSLPPPVATNATSSQLRDERRDTTSSIGSGGKSFFLPDPSCNPSKDFSNPRYAELFSARTLQGDFCATSTSDKGAIGLFDCHNLRYIFDFK